MKRNELDLDFPPEALLVSREVDLYPALHPERADLIDGAIGMHSSFHETFGYFVLDASKHPLPHILAWTARRAVEAKGTP